MEGWVDVTDLIQETPSTLSMYSHSMTGDNKPQYLMVVAVVLVSVKLLQEERIMALWLVRQHVREHRGLLEVHLRL